MDCDCILFNLELNCRHLVVYKVAYYDIYLPNDAMRNMMSVGISSIWATYKTGERSGDCSTTYTRSVKQGSRKRLFPTNGEKSWHVINFFLDGQFSLFSRHCDLISMSIRDKMNDQNKEKELFDAPYNRNGGV